MILAQQEFRFRLTKTKEEAEVEAYEETVGMERMARTQVEKRHESIDKQVADEALLEELEHINPLWAMIQIIFWGGYILSTIPIGFLFGGWGFAGWMIVLGFLASIYETERAKEKAKEISTLRMMIHQRRENLADEEYYFL